MKEMKNKNFYFEDIESAFAPAAEPGDAWNKGEALANAVAGGEYKKLRTEDLIRMLETGLDYAGAQGHEPENMLNMFKPGSLPSDGDARMGVVVLPSYALASVGIYVMNHFKTRLRVKYRDALQKLLERSFRNGSLNGHGFDAGKQGDLSMMMFGRAGAKQFIENNPDFSKNFTEAMERTIADISKAAGKDVPGKSQLENAKYRSRLTQTLYGWNNPDETTEIIFVYGTLMRGQRAHQYLQDCECIGNGLLRGYAMYDLGSFPGIVPEEAGMTVGEIYRIPAEMVQQLDRYESEGSLYYRIAVPAGQFHRHSMTRVCMISSRRWGSLRSMIRRPDRIYEQNTL